MSRQSLLAAAGQRRLSTHTCNAMSTRQPPESCQQFVSRRGETPGLLTDSTARSAWSDTVWTAFTALSRWRHGFELRWGCSQKDQVRRIL